MSTIFPGRFSAQSSEPFVVFLIGMRVNQLLALGSWPRVAKCHAAHDRRAQARSFAWPAARRVFRLLARCWRHSVLAKLRATPRLCPRSERRPPSRLGGVQSPHGGDGSVGIWHETYTVSNGQYETIYANMPRFGLGAAAEHLPSAGRLDTARSRIGEEKA